MENIRGYIVVKNRAFLNCHSLFQYQKENRPINQQEALLDREFDRVAASSGWLKSVFLFSTEVEDNHEVGENCYLLCLGSKEGGCTKTAPPFCGDCRWRRIKQLIQASNDQNP